jgi:hypothetical protein
MTDIEDTRGARTSIYLTYRIWKALWLIAQARKPKDETQRFATPDEVGSEIIAKAIEQQYPQLFEHQKVINKLERELIKTLQ